MNEMEQLIKRVDTLETEVKVLKEVQSDIKSDITGIKKDINYLATGFDKMEQSVKDTIKTWSDSLKKLESKDGEMWNTVIKQIITAIIAAVIGALVMYFK